MTRDDAPARETARGADERGSDTTYAEGHATDTERPANDGVLAGDVAVVTGAGRNIGRAIAERFAAEGAAVVVADVNADRARDVVAAIERDGGRARAAVGDVSTVRGAEGAVETAEDAFGPVDVLVNNAAVKERVPFLEMDLATFDRTLAVALRGAFCCTQAAARSMREGDGGRVVNVSSTSGLSGRADGVAYATAKAGLLNLTRSTAKALAPHGIRVNTLVPTRTGVRTLSPDAAGDDAAPAAAFEDHDTLVGRGGRPEDQAAAALYLVSPVSSFVTGTTLCVDGGRTA